MGGVFPNELIGCADRFVRPSDLVIAIHQLELNLLGEIAKRKAGLQRLENANRLAVILTHHRFLSGLIGLPNILHRVVFFRVAGTAGKQADNDK